MTAVQLGDGLTVSPLGFGGMALTPVYGGIDPEEGLNTLRHAVDAGITFIDIKGATNELSLMNLLLESIYYFEFCKTIC